ncbi:Flavin-dependent tryptophan halogenase PrnA [Pseudoalteromonas holothuriae]|uniref:Flavin-dependent tryptophan halogenase PrnA n=1 Tax=Pseudoalteromonas holothuriae TaxID=2963714 RepID=A0A9W4QSX8_9GAMM|nr:MULTISPECIES: tryptophan halogenase family protein [unclassified Pseudoalteromonas]CAH9051786.1 Flavin-dependent tryptophan halogenase PrnA [Pseudoalteromonas sp. CIP111854]CAH9057326.1 Flavin-dependent tryptophan halogenase PrnA [Pseudoalteromonas sp. CIP111951]
MSTQKIKQVVIVGGGTAGWLSATFLAKVMGKLINITLLESTGIGTVGVGEATIPPLQPFNSAMGIDEAAFIKATKATMKLGIQFEGWGKVNSCYMHAFGAIGKDFAFCEFHNHWLYAQQQDKQNDFWDFSLNYQAAKQHKFSKLNTIAGTNLPGIAYAYHFDAGLYAKFLAEHAKSMGVEHIKATVHKVIKDNLSGNISKLELDNGAQISGDLFIDCTGMHGLLIDKTLNTGFEDWSHWLPCDRALAVSCEPPNDERAPYTRSIAHQAGWQWQIPLQHRIGNGLVYASKHLSDEQAKQLLLNNLPGEALAEPKLIRFRTGRRLKAWHKNVVAIGLSSGFLEPLESTSIHLIQTAIVRLVKLFPHHGIEPSQVALFNEQSKTEFERIRDFIILHYKLNERDDSDFWQQCANMDIPDSLVKKMHLFKQTGQLLREDEELFAQVAWLQVFIGQGLIPKQSHPLVNSMNDEQRASLFDSLQTLIQQTVSAMPTHTDFLKR